MTSPFARSALFGDLFRDDEVAALFAPEPVLTRMIQVEIALTQAVAATGEIDPGVADSAVAAMERFRPDWPAIEAAASRDGMAVPELVRQLRAAAGAEAAGAIHPGATSQDILDTAMAAILRDVADLLAARLEALIGALSALSSRHGDCPLMGRTRMQDALPITAGARIDAWRRPLAGHLARLPEIRAEAARVQLGGPVGLRDGPLCDAVAADLALRLDLADAPVWHADRSGPVAFGGWLAPLAGSLGKMGQDVALMAQAGEIALAGSGGSSSMPHKNNPVRAEILVALARYAAAQQGGLLQAMVHEQERSGTAWALEWLILPSLAEAIGAALRHARGMIEAVERIGEADERDP